MNKKQFYHQMDWMRFTAVVEVPTKEELAQIITLNLYHETEVKFNVGYARMNPQDHNYCKQTGRTLSERRMEFHTFTLYNVVCLKDGTIEVRFVAKNYDCPLSELLFECEIDRDKIHFTFATLSDNFSHR